MLRRSSFLFLQAIFACLSYICLSVGAIGFEVFEEFSYADNTATLTLSDGVDVEL